MQLSLNSAPENESLLLTALNKYKDTVPYNLQLSIAEVESELKELLGADLQGFERRFDGVKRFKGGALTLAQGMENSNLEHTTEMLMLGVILLSNPAIIRIFSRDGLTRILHTIVLHDIGEIATGDIPVPEKERLSAVDQTKFLEAEMKYVRDFIANSQGSEELKARLLQYYEIYETGKTQGELASVFVKMLDMFEGLLTSLARGDDALEMTKGGIARMQRYMQKFTAPTNGLMVLELAFSEAIKSLKPIVLARSKGDTTYTFSDGRSLYWRNACIEAIYLAFTRELPQGIIGKTKFSVASI